MAHATCPKKKPGTASRSTGLGLTVNRLREDWRRCRLILLRLTNPGWLAVIPLECEVRRAHAEPPLRDLLEIVVTRLDLELHLVERIREANCDAHVVAIELLPDGDVRHLEGGELALLDLHRTAIEVVCLQNHRRIELRRRIETCGPRDRVRSEGRLGSTIGYHLEHVQTAQRIELRPKAQVAIQIGSPRITLGKILEAHRRHLTIVNGVGSVDVDANVVLGVTVERRQLNRTKLASLARAQLDRVGVLRIQTRITNEHVLLIEEHREWIELLGPGSANAS